MMQEIDPDSEAGEAEPMQHLRKRGGGRGKPFTAAQGGGAPRRRQETTARLVVTWVKWVCVITLVGSVAGRLGYDLWLIRNAPTPKPFFESPMHGSLVFANADEVLFNPSCTYSTVANVSAEDVRNLMGLLSPNIPCVCTPMVRHGGGRRREGEESGACMLAARGVGVVAHPFVKDLNPTIQVTAEGGSTACPGRFSEFTTPSVLELHGDRVDTPYPRAHRQRIEDAPDGVAHCVWRCVNAMRARDKDALLRPCYTQ